jgi:hypothetical protein
MRLRIHARERRLDMARTLVTRLGALLATAAGLAGAGCGADYATGSTAPVHLNINVINGGAPLDSDVRLSSGTICADIVQVGLSAIPKNPGATPNNFMDVIIERYEVRYFRSDGRGVEGVDVPHRISGYVTGTIDAESNQSEEGPIEVVRRQAKLEPPLSNLVGAQIVTMFAEITISGQTLAKQAVVASGRMQINFADFGDTATACPAQQ